MRWLLFSIFLSGAVAHAQGGPSIRGGTAERWRELTYDKVGTHLAFDGEDLWVGTAGGGVYAWRTGALPPHRPLYEKHTRANDGLADNVVMDMRLDGARRLWVATLRGLSVLDGGRWTTFDSSNSPLAEDLVTAVAVEDGDVVWIGTFDSGLYRYDGTWTRFHTGNSGLSDDFVTSIEVDLDGNKWVGAWGDGVDRFDGSTWSSFTPANSALPSTFVWVRAVDPFTGAIWFWCSDDDFQPDVGTVRFDGATWTAFLTTTSGIHSDYIHSVAVDAGGDTWFQGADALSRYDGTSWTLYPGIPSFFDLNLSRGKAIAVRGDGELWIGTASGIARLEGGGFAGEATPELWDNHVRAVAAGEAGEAWFGHRQGLQHYRRGTWERFTAATSGLPDDDVEALEHDGGGSLWVGTRGGAARYDGAAWTVFDPTTSGIHSDKILCLAAGADEQWFGSGFFGGGVSRRTPEGWTVFTPGNSGLASTFVDAIALDESRGEVWFATNAGASRYDGQAWTTFTTEDGLVDDRVQDVAVAANGDAWFATLDGVSRLSGGVFTSWDFASGLAGNRVDAVEVDRRGDVWIGYHDHGVGRFRRGSWTSWNHEDGLTNDRVLAIAVDAADVKWFGTDFNVALYRDGEYASLHPSVPRLRPARGR